ncbi:transcriptional repressor [Streptococcus gallolyticus]|uniref:Fur family transcriptional regulator n=1 Tax=Streptococcus hepaticus TaxID=3349163 RepID=UPI001C952D08|nr:transcriptional repressor [Streptococcus gallolyticus]MBY5040328.1 transcriptional repressor [Streptococcus gallolyticus]
MSQTAHTRAYEQVISHLKHHGVRITETRRAVIRYLIEHHYHPSAEMIYSELKPFFPNMSLATVYNNLKVLVEHGFVTEIKRSKDATTYYDFMGHDHLNVICENCGKITDVELDLPSIGQEIALLSGYKITREVTTAYGLCPDCATK